MSLAIAESALYRATAHPRHPTELDQIFSFLESRVVQFVLVAFTLSVICEPSRTDLESS